MSFHCLQHNQFCHILLANMSPCFPSSVNHPSTLASVPLSPWRIPLSVRSPCLFLSQPPLTRRCSRPHQLNHFVQGISIHTGGTEHRMIFLRRKLSKDLCFPMLISFIHIYIYIYNYILHIHTIYIWLVQRRACLCTYLLKECHSLCGSVCVDVGLF